MLVLGARVDKAEQEAQKVLLSSAALQTFRIPQLKVPGIKPHHFCSFQIRNGTIKPISTGLFLLLILEV